MFTFFSHFLMLFCEWNKIFPYCLEVRDFCRIFAGTNNN
jgi:hypothetical protein